MNIKKFTDFSLNENENKEEKIEDKIEDIKDAHNDVTAPSEEVIPIESDLDEVGDDSTEEVESTDSELADYTDYTAFDAPKDVAKNESLDIPSTGCKIVIINGSEPDSEIDKKTEEFKTKCGGDCKEIHLYQLNIQSPKKQEPKDGMAQVYEAIEGADAIIFACQVNKGKLSESLETAIARIKGFYKKEELKNKIFGAIVVGNEEKVKNDLILTALNDLHMVVCADCLCFANDKSSSNLTKMIDSITTLANATALIKKTDDIAPVAPISTPSEDDIKSYGEFADVEQTEDPEENGLPMEEPILNEDPIEASAEEENDDYVEGLKDMSDFAIGDEPEEVAGEEEERLIDNQDGTITQIHNGEKVTESIETEQEILTFDKFFKK
jgi:multimeric flavodoxin WrbA